MDERQKQIINILNQNDYVITTEDLSSELGVTSRTIKSDIKSINSELRDSGIKILAKRGSGVSIFIPENKRNWVNSFCLEYKNSLNREIRRYYIINCLLKRNNYVTIDDIAEEIYYSKGIVSRELKEVENILKKYSCHLIRNNYGVILNGDEQNIRSLGVQVLRKLNVIGDIDSVTLREWETNARNIIAKTEKYLQIPFSGSEEDFLVKYIVVFVFRNKSGTINSNNAFIDLEDENIACKILLNYISDEFKIKYASQELRYFSQIIQSTHLKRKIDIVNKNDDIEPIDYKRLTEVLIYIDNKYSTSLNKDDLLKQNLLNHIQPAINRAKYSIKYENNLLKDLKNEFTFAYELALEVTRVLNSKFKILINEDEIGLIAVHIAASLERNKKKARKYKAIVFTNESEGTKDLICAKIESSISNLKIVKEISKKAQYDDKDYDLCITTMAIDDSEKIPIVFVSPIIRENDIKNIKKTLAQIELKSEKEENVLIKYFSKETSDFQKTIASKEEAITYISKIMIERGICDKNATISALKREELSSTALGNFVAIPHPFPEVIKKTMIGILILHNSVDWGGNKVSIIFFICVKQSENMHLDKIIDELYSIINDKNIIRELLKAKDFEHFLNVLE